MATVLTVNFGWVLPVPGSEIDLWGTILNDTFGAVGGATPLDNIDTDLWAVKGTADGALQRGGGTMTGALNLVAGSPTGQQAVSFAFLDATYASLIDISGFAPLASPVFTGDPTAPTPAPGDNDFSIATTAFVEAVRVTLATADTNNLNTALAADKVVIANEQLGADYPLLLTDAGKMVVMNSATPQTLTVPQFTSVAFPMNTRVDLLQAGAGQVTVVADTNVTILSKGGKLKLTGQYSGATLWKVSTNIWVLIGDIV
jgi:hypothetical protein